MSMRQVFTTNFPFSRSSVATFVSSGNCVQLSGLGILFVKVLINRHRCDVIILVISVTAMSFRLVELLPPISVINTCWRFFLFSMLPVIDAYMFLL